MTANAILLSIRPKYAKKIFDGSKTVELRKVRPKRIGSGTLILVYVSSPIKSLVGAFKVDRITEKPLNALWNVVRNKAGITREEFDTYYAGTSTGVAIFFDEAWCLPEPIALEDLRDRLSEFYPPQDFRYAKVSELTLPQIAGFLGDKELTVQDYLLEAQ
jgi:predicted transcriptional regulator